MSALKDDDVCPNCGEPIGAEGSTSGECSHCTGSLQNWICKVCDSENVPQAWPICADCGTDNETSEEDDEEVEEITYEPIFDEMRGVSEGGSGNDASDEIADLMRQKAQRRARKRGAA